MNPKKYIRLEPDGVHLPDADVGDILYYGIDFTEYFGCSEQPDEVGPVIMADETILSVEWAVPEEVILEESFVSGKVALAKLGTHVIGCFKITCTMISIADGNTQTQVIPLILTVY